MPELPEVETLRRGLARSVQGRRIIEVVVANPKILKGQPEGEFRDRVIDTTIGAIVRRGKYLLLGLSSRASRNEIAPPATAVAKTPTFFLCVHLKMRGQLLLEPTSSTPGPYHCVSLTLTGGGAEAGGADEIGAETVKPGAATDFDLRFYDMWTWGEMRALTGAERDAIAGLAEMGPEPLEAGWDGAALRARLGKRRTPIKTALLDQKIVAGVGNIYADESLFRSGIHPERPAVSLTIEEAERLSVAIRAILTAAVEGGGTQSEEYVDLAGAAGRYQPLVYDRGGKPCAGCGATLSRIRLGGRGTVFCPSCQS